MSRRRNAVRGWATGTSLLLHALALILLAWTARTRLGPPPPAAPPDMVVTLAPAQPSARADRAEARVARNVIAPPAAAPPPVTRAQPPRPSSPTAKPSPRPAPVQGSGPATPQMAQPSPPRSVTGPQAGGDVRGFLRATVGCDHRDAVGLTAAERTRCDEHAGEVARAAPPFGPIPSDKLIGFSAAAAAAERRRAAREGALGTPVTTCEGAGSNLGMGCLPPEASHHVPIP